ncbi:hypothetical protein B7494_g6599 [Chlorociboria aeruginascens]|nr:hypothetical protein B7494_g6599 [Chlorociboria aeruginascens]
MEYLYSQIVSTADLEQSITEPLEDGEILEQQPQHSKYELEFAARGYVRYLTKWCLDQIWRYRPLTNPHSSVALYLLDLEYNDIERVIDALPAVAMALPAIRHGHYDNYDNIRPLINLCTLLSLPIEDGKVLGESGVEWLRRYSEQYDAWDMVIQEHTGFSIESIVNRENTKGAWKRDVRARAIRFR